MLYIELEDRQIPIEFLEDWKSKIVGRNLPNTTMWSSSNHRKYCSSLNRYLVSLDYARPAVSRYPHRLTESADIDSAISALPIEEMSEDIVADEEIIDENGGGYIYFIRASNGLIKIGKTDDISKRFRGLETMSPVSLNLIFSCHVDNVNKIERFFHKAFDKKRRHGEWFKINQDDLRYAKAILEYREEPEKYNFSFEPYYRLIIRAKQNIRFIFWTSCFIVAHWLLYIGIMNVLPK